MGFPFNQKSSREGNKRKLQNHQVARAHRCFFCFFYGESTKIFFYLKCARNTSLSDDALKYLQIMTILLISRYFGARKQRNRSFSRGDSRELRFRKVYVTQVQLSRQSRVVYVSTMTKCQIKKTTPTRCRQASFQQAFSLLHGVRYNYFKRKHSCITKSTLHYCFINRYRVDASCQCP